MSYQERRALVTLFTSILISGVYFLYAMQKHPTGSAYAPEVFKFWGSFFLIFLPVAIVTQIIIHIFFVILHVIATNEGEPSITDERDRLIELKSARNGMYVFILGVFIAVGSLVLDYTPSVMFTLIFFFAVISGITGELSNFYFYRRGV